MNSHSVREIRPMIWDGDVLSFLDQTRLPQEEIYFEITGLEMLCDAIRALKIRGAPLIGVAAAAGYYVCMKAQAGLLLDRFFSEFERVGTVLAAARPTAVNLQWAVARMKKTVLGASPADVRSALVVMEREARAIFEEDKKLCRRIGENGSALIKDGDNVLTHCNAGGLATSGYGTALAVLFHAHESGKRFHVYVDETRPLLQGSRLTAWELVTRGIPCTLICDNMAGYLMQQGKISCAVVGADRIAVNGDAANKIGTYSAAVLARAHKIPFYIAAPYSTIDFSIASGREIPIEQRDPDEVRGFRSTPAAPAGVQVYNPSFDVTPNEFISAIITERAVVRAPFDRNIRGLYDAAEGTR